jgi:hypothetical protein
MSINTIIETGFTFASRKSILKDSNVSESVVDYNREDIISDTFFSKLGRENIGKFSNRQRILRSAAKKGGKKEVATRKYLKKNHIKSRRSCKVLHLTESETRKVDEVLPVTAELYKKMENDNDSDVSVNYCDYCDCIH